MQNNEEHKQNEGPIHWAFLNVLAFHALAKKIPPTKFLGWRHLVDFVLHCNVGAAADTFGWWQFGGNYFLARHWQKQAAGGRCSAWKILRRSKWYIFEATQVVHF